MTRYKQRSCAWALFAAILVSVAGCATTPRSPDAESPPFPLASALPDTLPENGWHMLDQPALFTPDTIFEHINGEADLYFPYGLVLCAATTYVPGVEPMPAITADVYEMGSPLDAFGIYSNYRDPTGDFAQIGAEAYVNDYEVIFYQDRYFVRLTAIGGAPDQNRANLLACARAIQENLPGTPQKPPELALMSDPAIQAQSVMFIAESVMGNAFWPRGFVADATIAGADARAFVVLAGSEEAAGQALSKYDAYVLSNSGKTRLDLTALGPQITAVDPLYKGTIMIQAGTCVVGVARLPNPELGVDLVDKLARSAWEMQLPNHQ